MTIKSKFYDHFTSKFYDKQLDTEMLNDVRERAVEKLELQQGARVLEVGCGTGLNQPFLAKAIGQDGRVIALDASVGMLEQARARAQSQNYMNQMRFIEGDARRLDALVEPEIGGGKVDAVLLTLILTVVPNWRGVFATAFDQLKPGGRCVIMDSYWSKPTLYQRAMCWAYAADAKRATFEPLMQIGQGFEIDYLPPEEKLFFIASGTKT